MGWFDRVHMYVSISLIPRFPCHMGTWERGYVSIYGQLTSTDDDGPEICEPDLNRLTCTGGNNDANRRCGTRERLLSIIRGSVDKPPCSYVSLDYTKGGRFPRVLRTLRKWPWQPTVLSVGRSS